ncbi:beta-arrestin-2 [Chrysemys picta bellii]|uniref:beta-arrestin-2 n=1 Tax=Chrysemys picta bellii TaxID=8478 RepID=UPI0032B1019C
MHPEPPEAFAPARPQSVVPETDVPVDTNLIEFETHYGQDDDIVFEDFARLRLKGGVKDDPGRRTFLRAAGGSGGCCPLPAAELGALPLVGGSGF